MEYHLRVNGATLLLHEDGSSAEELSNLLTARFGAVEASTSRAVALEDVNTALVFPLNVVASRPDFVAQSERLLVLFSMTPETILLNELRGKGLLSDQEVRTLTPLTHDPFVTAAFEVYREEGDETDLVDTLQRIVAIRLGGSGAKAAAPSAEPRSKQASEKPKLSGTALLEQLTAALKLEAFPQEQLKAVCKTLNSKGKLSSDETAVLFQLINKELPHLQAAYEIFLEESDEQALTSSLRRVAKHFGIERVVRGQPYATAILNAFASGNPLVCGAWDVYVDEHNEDDFRDTLARCYARLNGKGAKPSNEDDENEERTSKLYASKPSEEKAALRRFILWLHTQNKINSEQGQILMAKVDAGSPEAEAAMRKYLASERFEADGDELLNEILSLLEEPEDDVTGEDAELNEARGLEDTYGENPEEDEALRESITLFLDDLCETKKLLSRSSVEKLKTLVDAGDQRLLAAFDVFNEELDLDDLVDTLQKLSEKVIIVGGDDQAGDDMDDGDYDFDSILDIIVQMGLSLESLEMVRDAMEVRHPDLEQAIDNFAHTHDEEEFKRAIVEFCQNQL